MSTQYLNFRASAALRALAAGAVLALGLTGFAANATPLDDYVAAPDPEFTYDATPAKVTKTDRYTASVYHMVSQKWLDASKVDRPLWEHWVVVIVPKEVAFNKAMVFIDGGSNGGPPPMTDEALAQVAVLTKSVLIDVKQIPNEPLRFTDEKDSRYQEQGRSEDAIIAYCWDKYLRTGDAIWLPRLPMTKAVVKAMDLVQKERPEIDGFFVAGGSKRGWTTWTVAAVDKRVIAITPAVIDVLNVVKSLENHHQAYGFWAPAITDYADMDVLSRLQTPQFKALTDIVDPYAYRDRLTMPKYLINSAGDQFFPPNSWEFYWDGLKGEKYLRYVPNTDHGLNLDAYFNMASFYHAILAGTPRPKFTWQRNADGSLEVHCETKPESVLLWQATNPKARDFRLESIGKAYASTPVTDSGNGVYRADLKAPEKGWTAFFLEMKFTNPDFSSPFVFTTGISVLPDTFPGSKETR